ncbi:MAG TPA: hypothetical protein VF624_17580 [Tepidisphaeraceae bacterium]|jgi:hypothetical protein
MRSRPINTPIECLEARRLLAVSATTLAGPQTVGFSRTYNATSSGLGPAGTSIMFEINGGGAKLDGLRVLRVDQSFKTTTPTVMRTAASSYQRLDGLGLRVFQTSTRARTSVSLTTFDPFVLSVPPSMVAGKSYPKEYTATRRAVSNPSVPPVVTTYTSSVRLVSEKPVGVRTRAGRFAAYELVTETTGRNAAGTATTVSRAWIVPSIGMVKMVTTSPGSTLQSTFDLRSYLLAQAKVAAVAGDAKPRTASVVSRGPLVLGAKTFLHLGTRVRIADALLASAKDVR